MIPMLISIFVGFVGIFALYTDKKTVVMGLGFILMSIMLIVLGIEKLVILGINHDFDIKYLLIVIICLLLDTVIVNIILGTYWCSLMYGKGFMVYFVSRMVKNLVQLPINIGLAYYILGLCPHLTRANTKDY